MRISAKTVTTLAIAGLIGGGLSISPPLHAQESSAGQEMHESGASAKSAAGQPAISVKYAYLAITDQIGDATLT